MNALIDLKTALQSGGRTGLEISNHQVKEELLRQLQTEYN